MNTKLERVMKRIENGDIRQSFISELLDVYYQCVIEKIDEIFLTGDTSFLDEKEEYPEEFMAAVSDRKSGIGQALIHLLDSGYDINEAYGSENALMLAVGMADAPMVRFLLEHGADACSWPEMNEFDANIYLDGIGERYAESVDYNYNGSVDYIRANYDIVKMLVEKSGIKTWSDPWLTTKEDGTIILG